MTTHTTNRLTAVAFSLQLFTVGALAGDLISPDICDPDTLDALSEERQAFCAAIDGLEGRDLLKAQLVFSLRETNQPPIARLEVFDRAGEGVPVRPTHVDLDASSAFDPDGFVERLTFMLFDADTGEVLAGPVFTRAPLATLRVNRALPSRLRATVTLEDDVGEIDTAEISFAGPETNCPLATDPALFMCTLQANVTECQPTAANTAFTMADLLAAAQLCDRSIGGSTPLRISAWGGGGGVQPQTQQSLGGAGGTSGLASLGTTQVSLSNSFGLFEQVTFCYGIGQQGVPSVSNGAGGGAATILRTCDNVDQDAPTGVLLIAGGGGGGAALDGPGGAGGIAFSVSNAVCPPDCDQGSSSLGAGFDGGSAQGNANGKGGRNASGGAAGTGRGDNAINGLPGADGVGGAGGMAETFAGFAGWSQGDPKVTGDAGSGGFGVTAGAGGGGFGGGGSGGKSTSGEFTNAFGGGGGGGSYAFESTQTVVQTGTGGALPGSLGFFFFTSTETEQESE